MGAIESLSNYLKNERNQKKVNRFVVVSLVLLILIGLVNRGTELLPENPLYFLTCDAFELAFTCCLALLIYYKILPKESLKLKVVAILMCLLSILALAYLKDFRRGTMYFRIWSEFSSFVGMTFMFTSVFYFFDNLNLFIDNSYLKTKKALRSAENKLLRQQLNPHFLFNAFNSLYSMSLSHNPKTPESILRMSGMMRYITDEVEASKTPLARELKFIDDYVKIEQLRFGHEADIRLKTKGNWDNIFIEPLLLVTLVENAFKHGFYTNDTSSFVHIDLNVFGKSIHFSVSNSITAKQHFQTESRVGKGLALLRKRLELAYGSDANIEIQEDEKTYQAILKIQNL